MLSPDELAPSQQNPVTMGAVLLLSLAGDLVRPINPTLLGSPPPSIKNLAKMSAISGRTAKTRTTLLSTAGTSWRGIAPWLEASISIQTGTSSNVSPSSPYHPDTGEGGRGREGKGEASEDERARADEGARARAMALRTTTASNKSGRRTTGWRGGVALK
jgi:hypothetical protein